MRIPDPLRKWLLARLRAWFIDRRPPDFIIGGQTNEAYMNRWYVIPRNRFLNIYLHEFHRSDDDRALHDHPWGNVSILLEGSYMEFVPESLETWRNSEAKVKFGKDLQHNQFYFIREAGGVYARGPRSLHRIEMYQHELDSEGKARVKPVVSLFITGPKVREWGFACPQGWRHWKDFLAPGSGQATGRSESGAGCD